MEINSTFLSQGISSLRGPQQARGAEQVMPQQERTAIVDELMFSDEALQISENLSTDSSSGTVRFDLINRIKAEIADGSYETDDKMDIAFERMLQRTNPR